MFPTSPLNPSLNGRQKHSYLLPFLAIHAPLTILACSLPTIFSKRLLRTQIDTQAYSRYACHRKRHVNGQTCLWRSYTFLSDRSFIWGFMRSLMPSSTGIRTLMRALYIRFQAIYQPAAFSKSSVIATSLALRVTKERGITYLLIRSGGISLNL